MEDICLQAIQSSTVPGFTIRQRSDTRKAHSRRLCCNCPIHISSTRIPGLQPCPSSQGFISRADLQGPKVSESPKSRLGSQVIDICNTLTYCDLAKAANGYGFGMVKIDLRTKSYRGVEFHAYTHTGKASGNLESKYKICNYGLTFTQKWNTDNTLGTELSLENKLAEGLKLTLDTVFVPNTWKKSGKLKASYKQNCFSLGNDVDIDFSGPTIYNWAGLGFEGWLAGYQMSFDTVKFKLSQNNFALGYKAADFQLHIHMNDGTEFGGSIYQKVNEKIETAINLAWTSGNSSHLGIAAKYKLDYRTSLSARVNNASLVGLGYTQTLQPGVKLTLSALVDGKNFNTGGHKVGLRFELEA
ncbi:LOW QUALITY PROTEIN: non-selective voltage-gated ion channel VDAC3-like [Thomomys bottae]